MLASDAPSPRFVPPGISCDEAIAHASKDKSLLYLLLLPREIRAIVNSIVSRDAWRFGGKLVPHPMPVPPPQLQLDYDRIVLPNGDDVIITHQKPPAASVRFLFCFFTLLISRRLSCKCSALCYRQTALAGHSSFRCSH